MNNVALLATIVGAMLGTAGLGGILKILFSRIHKLELDLEKERVRCDNKLRVLYHRSRNQRSLIYSFLHLFDLPAEHRERLLGRVREQLATIEQAEALEVGAALADLDKEEATQTPPPVPPTTE